MTKKAEEGKSGLPPINDTIEFIEKLEDLADGNRQRKYVEGLAIEFAKFVNKAEEIAETCIHKESLLTFLKKKRQQSEELKEHCQEYREGVFDAYDEMIRYLND